MRHTILLFISCFSIFAYGQESVYINWSDNYRLKYEDFQGAIPSNKKFTQAQTNCGIEIKFEPAGDVVNVSIWSYVRKNRSWMRNGAKNDYTLKHEQGHFDITEIYTRKMRKRLGEIKVGRIFGGFKIKRVCKKLYRRHGRMQRKYDRATGYAVKEKNQEKWIKKIADELKELSAYNNFKVNVKFR
jgi:hypothetical protein